MASSSDPNRQRRQRQNRAQREALKARTAAAAAPRPSREAPSAGKGALKDAAAGGKTSGRTTGAATSADGGRPRPKRLGDTPVDLETLEGSYLRKLIQVPGGVQVLMSTVLMAVSLYFLVSGTYPDPALPEDADPTLSFGEAFTTFGKVVLLGVPILTMIVVIATSLTPVRRRVWLGAVVLLVAVAVTSAAAILFLFPVGLLGFACFRAAKVEGPQEPLLSFRRLRSRGRDTGGDDAAERSEEG